MTRFRGLSTGNLLGIPTLGRDDWKLKGLTLAFSGKTNIYEKDFKEDYYNRSLNPMRFSLILSIFFFGIFAFLDALLLPELKSVFWFIRFGIISPLLLAVIIFSFSPHFKRFMQPVLAAIMYITGLSIIVMTIYATKQAANYSYYAGLFLILLIGYTFVKSRLYMPPLWVGPLLPLI